MFFCTIQLIYIQKYFPFMCFKIYSERIMQLQTIMWQKLRRKCFWK